MSFDPYALPIPDLGMLCRKCRYPLGGLPEHRCPECGRAFDIDEHIPKGDFPSVIFNGKEVPLTVEIMNLMQVYRIPFMDALRHVDAGFGFDRSVNTRSRLAVPRAAYFEVIDMLRRRAAGQPLPEPPPALDGPEWPCGDCGESNPGNFAECWNCGAVAATPTPH
jgi:hypothetical protein